MAWTLATIRSKVRELIKRPGTFQISNADLDIRINEFYQNKLPVELEPKRLQDYYRFTTIGAYQIAVGDGAQKTWSGTLSSVPQKSGVQFTDGNETFESDDTGALWGTYGGTGTINYSSGAYSITFNEAPALGAQIGVTFDGVVLPDNILSVNKPLTFSGNFAELLDDPSLFWGRWPTYQAIMFVAIPTWTGSTPYGLNAVVQPPVLNGYNYACVQNGISDSSAPTWSTTIGGTTVDGTVQWLTIHASQQVPVSSPYIPNTPIEVLSYGRKLTMRPPPDMEYMAKMTCILKPAAFSADGDAPLEDGWGSFIAAGTAYQYAEDIGDEELMSVLAVSKKTHLKIARRPDLKQLSGTRAAPRW